MAVRLPRPFSWSSRFRSCAWPNFTPRLDGLSARHAAQRFHPHRRPGERERPLRRGAVPVAAAQRTDSPGGRRNGSEPNCLRIADAAPRRGRCIDRRAHAALSGYHPPGVAGDSRPPGPAQSLRRLRVDNAARRHLFPGRRHGEYRALRRGSGRDPRPRVRAPRGAGGALFGRAAAALRPAGTFLFDLAGPGRLAAHGPTRSHFAAEDWTVLIEAEETAAPAGPTTVSSRSAQCGRPASSRASASCSSVAFGSATRRFSRTVVATSCGSCGHQATRSGTRTSSAAWCS